MKNRSCISRDFASNRILAAILLFLNYAVDIAQIQVAALLVRVLKQGHVAYLCADGLADLFEMRTGEAYGRPLAHTGSKGNGLCPARHQHLGAGNCALARAAPAAHKAHDFTLLAKARKAALALGHCKKVRCARTDVLGLLTADNAYLLHGASLLLCGKNPLIVQGLWRTRLPVLRRQSLRDPPRLPRHNPSQRLR